MQQPVDSVEEENQGSMNYRGRAKIYLQNGHKDATKMNGDGPALFNGNGILEPRSKTLNLGFTECSQSQPVVAAPATKNLLGIQDLS